MELFARHESDTNQDDESQVGEVIGSYRSDDGSRLNYTLRMPDGTKRELAIPTGRLGVIFTLDGPIEL